MLCYSRKQKNCHTNKHNYVRKIFIEIIAYIVTLFCSRYSNLQIYYLNYYISIFKPFLKISPMQNLSLHVLNGSLKVF